MRYTGSMKGQSVRIMAGELKGRRLAYPDDRRVRPTMQKTKGSLFSSLGELVPGAVFVDLFAGAGAVGIEALSRGARFVHFVERLDIALAALSANLSGCGVGADRYAIHGADACRILTASPSPFADATVIYADPPYEDEVVRSLTLGIHAANFPRLACFVLEHSARAAHDAPDGLELTKTRRFGDTSVSYFNPAKD